MSNYKQEILTLWFKIKHCFLTLILNYIKKYKEKNIYTTDKQQQNIYTYTV